jgi:hypothetical protein
MTRWCADHVTPALTKPRRYSPPTKPFLGIGHVFAYQNVDLRLEKAFSMASAQRISVVQLGQRYGLQPMHQAGTQIR